MCYCKNYLFFDCVVFILIIFYTIMHCLYPPQVGGARRGCPQSPITFSDCTPPLIGPIRKSSWSSYSDFIFLFLLGYIDMSGGITVQRVNSWCIQKKDVLTKYNVIKEFFEEFGSEIDTSYNGLSLFTKLSRNMTKI